ncbi:hypothetical protein T4B_11095 [Trichinella pseudospiralis]|uniref:Uncharacterized protein n=1 Tax=Trichinella pseudospiralis TaxID=6337 RepID=A0A0V1GNL6_TRIPS|nr:hypothetical protein T4B_11095 [Trichinella pseudospiralis]
MVKLQDYSAATFYIKHPRSHFSTIAEYFSFYHHLVVVVLPCRLRDGRSWHEVIGSLTAQSCILRVCCAKEVHNHKRTCVIYLHLQYLSARDAA